MTAPSSTTTRSPSHRYTTLADSTVTGRLGHAPALLGNRAIPATERQVTCAVRGRRYGQTVG